MRYMALITVNNPDMTSADWIAHEAEMHEKYTHAFTRAKQVATLNDRQAIITLEMTEADMPKMDAHVAGKESVAFDTRAAINVELFSCHPE